MFDNHQVDEHEYSIDVPSLYMAPNYDATITIRMSAHGGGTVGESYAHNSWTYSVESNGTEIISGDDLRCNGTPGTHAGMSRTLATFLSAAGESLRYSGDDSEYTHEYDEAQREFLTAEYERFSMFADSGECNV
jgi:hypothetical protein